MYNLQTLCTRRSWYWCDYLLWRTRYRCVASCPAFVRETRSWHSLCSPPQKTGAEVVQLLWWTSNPDVMHFVSLLTACFPRIVIPPLLQGFSSPSLQVRAPPAKYTGWESWLFCNIHIPVPLPIPVLQDQVQQGVRPWKPTQSPLSMGYFKQQNRGILCITSGVVRPNGCSFSLGAKLCKTHLEFTGTAAALKSHRKLLWVSG